MYLWIVIATFMVALLSYNLSVRPDVDRAYMETKAQTVVGKFKIQHNAFKRYLNSQKIPANPALGDPLYVSYKPGFGYNAGQILGSDDTEPYAVEQYFPMGYLPDDETYSKVFCFEPSYSDSDYVDYEVNCNDAAVMADDRCCSVDYVEVYAVSWAPIPSRWLNRSSTPTTDMMSVMSKSGEYGRCFGYVTTAEDVPYAVVSGGVKPNEQIANNDLPYRVVYSAVLNDEDYQSTCQDTPCFIAIHQVFTKEESSDD
ncbi:MAG: hypothetical protein IJS26_02485 [Alphaproteobacteria bacterium]|nr:hypothetical protein [Alphaproteobacteria bacterium]